MTRKRLTPKSLFPSSRKDFIRTTIDNLLKEYPMGQIHDRAFIIFTKKQHDEFFNCTGGDYEIAVWHQDGEIIYLDRGSELMYEVLLTEFVELTMVKFNKYYRKNRNYIGFDFGGKSNV